jgi:hypothetical protein
MGSGALVWRGTEAAFTATTFTGSNTWGTGSVTLTDDDLGGVAFTATGLVPGSTDTKCIVVTYGGSVATTGVKLYATAYSDTGGLAANITLTVTEGSGGSYSGCAAPVGTQIYSGSLAAFGAKADFANGVGSWAPTAAAQTMVYRITYTVGASAPQSASCAVTFTWEARADT